ncbi:sensor histidine kinase [Nonomuraea roseoviolacea]|uniref:histidine kinase n=1 Tax=Nonomuraea roseoviolacea subsp. carminata TaxID=160689 RepID=A0ABT1JRS4_9ACTN|nr:histidine kinase [Nonomuraea roseoviolacea]MCP2344446.1 signal transduction histidine kinase [Nonomuraea roseoviolacea subsp. carminata]
MTKTGPDGTPAGAARFPVIVAAAVTLLVVALTAGTVVLDVVNVGVVVPPGADLDEASWPYAVAGLAQVVPGALLLRRLPRHPVAWVLVLSGVLWGLNGFSDAWSLHAVYGSPGTPGAALAYWLYARFGAMLLVGLPLLILLFPDGRLPAGRGWRWLSLAGLGLTAFQAVVWLLVPMDVLSRHWAAELPAGIARLDLDLISVGLPYEVWRPLIAVAQAAVPLSLVVPFAVMVRRYRAADPERRAQIRWLTWAALVDMFVLLLPLVAPPGVPAALLCVALGLTSGAVLVAVTKYRLYDIDRLLPATFLYGVLAALAVVIDIVVFTVAGSVLGERESALTAMAIVAVAYAPLRTWLWRAARRLARGARDDPYATVSTLAQRLELATEPDDQLRALATTVAEAFRLPYVRVEIERPGGVRSVVEHGSPRGPSLSLPVAYRGEAVGRLVLCRADLTERDQRLLGDLVRQAAAAARASELSTDLQRIRARLVLAREEERRRLRRDLHDGLGPSLGAVALRIEAARNLAASAPAESDRILEQTAAEVTTVLADVRRLVHDLRPPALDELGLLRAVEQLADRLGGCRVAAGQGSGGPHVAVSGDGLAALPAAVEVAAYRIVSEALANVVRHSGAARCDVTLGVREGALEVLIRDDGRGIGPDVVAGVGMLSLRERTAELGGECEVSCPAEGGTLVRARLPLAQVQESPAISGAASASALVTAAGSAAAANPGTAADSVASDGSAPSDGSVAAALEKTDLEATGVR